MGNQPKQSIRVRNKNSFSLDFGHKLPDKILPTDSGTSALKLQPIASFRARTPQNKFSQLSGEGIQSQTQLKRHSQINQNRLNKLVLINDQLRKQLMKISSQLTTKLQKKKFKEKKIQVTNDRRRDALKKQLQNAYKQVDMYKKKVISLKDGDIGIKGDTKITQIQNRIAIIDRDIGKTMESIESVKNITLNQNNGLKKDRNQLVIQQVEQSKREIQNLKNRIKDLVKESRKKQKRYMQQHQYMFNLQAKIKQLQNQQMQAKLQAMKQKQQQKYDQRLKQIQKLEKESEQLKQLHDAYHKKINGIILQQKVFKEQRKNIKHQIQQKNKEIQSLRYKRDAMVKQIKDHLDVFANAPESQQEEFSEFQSQDQQIDPIQQQEDQRGTFDIDHLKDHNIKQKINQQKLKKNMYAPRYQEAQVQPKVWQKMTTKIVQKGKPKQEQVKFTSGIKQPKREMKIIQMNIWMNRKKQILSIQPIYLVDDNLQQGNKSSQNTEDEYKVVYKLEEHDYLKSILGIFGKQGYLDYIVLQSNFGKISRIGRGQTIGDNFAIGVAKQETPVQIFGASTFDGLYSRINRLQVQVLLDYTINNS